MSDSDFSDISFTDLVHDEPSNKATVALMNSTLATALFTAVDSSEERQVIEKIREELAKFGHSDRVRLCNIIGTKVFADNVNKTIPWGTIAKLFSDLALDSIAPDKKTILKVAREKYCKLDEENNEHWTIGPFLVVLKTTDPAEYVNRWYYYVEYLLSYCFPQEFMNMKREYGHFIYSMCINNIFVMTEKRTIALKKDYSYMSTDPTVIALMAVAQDIVVPDHCSGVDIMGYILEKAVISIPESLARPLFDMDKEYHQAMENVNPIEVEELKDWQKDLSVHRDERRKNKHFDSVSKLVSNLYPTGYSNVAMKFAVPIYDNSKVLGEPTDIIVGGVGLKNNFGPLIRARFPGARLHFCDVDEKCRRAAESVPNSTFTCCSVLKMAQDKKWPVISDAVLPFSKGSGAERGTWIQMNDNLHQLALLEMATKGEIPWAIVKVPGPFGDVKGKDRSFMEVFWSKSKAWKFYGSIRYHNGESLIAAGKGIEGSEDNWAEWLTHLKTGYLVERVRQKAFIYGLYPTRAILEVQVNRINSFKAVKQLVDSAFNEFVAVPVVLKKSVPDSGVKVPKNDIDFSNIVSPDDNSRGKGANVKNPSDKNGVGLKSVWAPKQEVVRKEAPKEVRTSNHPSAELRPGQAPLSKNFLAKKQDRRVDKKEEKSSTSAGDFAKIPFQAGWSLGDIMDKFSIFQSMDKEEKLQWKGVHSRDYHPFLQSAVDFVGDSEEDGGVTPQEVMNYAYGLCNEKWLAVHIAVQTVSKVRTIGNKWFLNKAEKEHYETRKFSKGGADNNYFFD